MSFSCVGRRRVRVAIVASSLALLGSFFAATEADARRYRGRPVAKRNVYSPPFSAMVVDGKTGRVLHAVKADELRHPASVTKVMTLYLLFEQLDRGSLKLDSELKVSAQAASMAPSKLGLRPGSTIEVEDAIKALITKSANDVAAVVAENLAGTEGAFADRMTQKARRLGMSRTVFRNASGLPDPAQVTTARDLVRLGRAIQERFPRLYKYFQTRSFEYGRRVIGNHNRLLGRVEGVDGIKTGFTRASGFNLLTSARSNGRHIVAAVLGGRSGASRDNTMAGLVKTHLAAASTTGRSSVFADVGPDGDDVPARAVSEPETTSAIPEAPRASPSPPKSLPRPFAPPRQARESLADEGASASAQAAGLLGVVPGGKIEARLPAMPAVPAPPPAPVRTASAGPPALVPVPREPPPPPPPALIQPTEAGSGRPGPEKAAEPLAGKPTTPTRWVIQLAAEDDEAKARRLLADAKSRSGRLLAKAQPFTEKVVRGGSVLYRARFSGFEEPDSAQEACRTLKSRGFACFATRS